MNKTMHPLPTISLRAMEPEDLDMLYKVENDPAVWNIGTTSVPYSRYLLHDYIANTTNDIYADGQVRMIIEKADHQAVGIVDIVNFNPAHNRAELSIVIRNEFRKQGYATSAIKEVLSYALGILHLHQLYAIVEKDNTVSHKLFKSLGFDTTTILKDWLYDGREYHDVWIMQRTLTY